jgi:proteasome accessory factor C
VQRWLDVLAALLRRSPDRLTFAELAEQVPAYAKGLAARGAKRWQEAAVARMWERDKDELRQLGVPIAVYADPQGSRRAYGLDARDFYLPFVHCLGQPAAARSGGPASLPTVTFTPDALEVVARAAQRVTQLGDPALADAARRALVSVTHDLRTLDPARDMGESIIAAPLDPAVLDAVGEALVRGRRIRCTYRSMHRDDTTPRVLEPLGLVFQLGHWYVVARDPADGHVKTFRASRMSGVQDLAPSGVVEPPPGFSLTVHADSREAWELGDGEATEVRLSVRAHVPIATLPRATPVRGAASRDRSQRRVTMRVRRLEPFLRWVLSHGGDVRPVAPRPVVQAFRALVARTLATHEGQG